MKRTQKLVTWGIVILVVLVVLLMLVSNLRRSSRVVLPDTNTSAEGGGDLPAEGGALTVVEVTPETVQAAIETLRRPEAYSRTVTVEYLWTGGQRHHRAVYGGQCPVDPRGSDPAGRPDPP